jgi:hypothetical protein
MAKGSIVVHALVIAQELTVSVGKTSSCAARIVTNHTHARTRCKLTIEYDFEFEYSKRTLHRPAADATATTRTESLRLRREEHYEWSQRMEERCDALENSLFYDEDKIEQSSRLVNGGILCVHTCWPVVGSLRGRAAACRQQ